MIAAVAEVGRPSVSIGTSTPAAEALLAASGPATPSIAPVVPNSSVLRQLLLQRVGQEGRDFGAAGRQRADREAEQGAAQPRLPRAPPFLRGHVERAFQRHDLVLAGIAARRDVERLADREQPDRHDDDVDAVEQFREAEGEARLPGLEVDADHAEEEAEEQRATARVPPRSRAPPTP